MIEPQTYFPEIKGVIHAEDVALPTLAKKWGTPLYVYSEAAIHSAIQEFQKHLKTVPHLLCFAMKSNSNPYLLKKLKSWGLGLDVVSGGELFLAKKSGFSGSKIVFSGVGKSKKEIKEALTYSSSGIHSFNVESSEELLQIEALCRDLKKKARIAFRYNPDIDPKTHPHISTGLKENKFGLQKKEILSLVKEFKNHSHLRIEGLSVHIGSQILSLKPFEDAFANTFSLLEEIEKILERPLQFIDLGGGLGIRYENENPPSIESYCKLIQNLSRKRPDLHFLIEPGRIPSAQMGILVTEVQYLKHTPDRSFCIVDAGMHTLLRPALYQSRHRIRPIKVSSTSSRPYDVVGPICESADCFQKGVSLPENLEAGDLLTLFSVGAYGYSMASRYNAQPLPAEVWVHGKKSRLIRKRESYSDLIRGTLKP